MTTGDVTPRKIIHIDMDCFYAAIEMRDNPSLQGKPIAVGGNGARSVVCTASYEARAFGVHSAMPMMRAKAECPGLIVVEPRFDVYKAASRNIREIFADYTDLVEPLSLDEAYLDVSDSPRFATSIAKEIRQRIYKNTSLTASAGIAPNKMLAKIASDWRKPNGQFTITPEQVETFIASMPIRKIPGIGPVMAEQLRKLGAETCSDLQSLEFSELVRHFGKSSFALYQRCRGQDERPVEAHSARKSVSTERTFEEDLESLESCLSRISDLHDELMKDLLKTEGRAIHKLVVKVKFSDFQQTTKECVYATPDLGVFKALLEEAYSRSPRSVRLLGLGVKFYDEEKYQQLLLNL